jgi:hypothetical protein
LVKEKIEIMFNIKYRTCYTGVGQWKHKCDAYCKKSARKQSLLIALTFTGLMLSWEGPIRLILSKGIMFLFKKCITSYYLF